LKKIQKTPSILIVFMGMNHWQNDKKRSKIQASKEARKKASKHPLIYHKNNINTVGLDTYL